MTKAAIAALFALFALGLPLAAAHADSQAFTGNWENPARDQSGIAHVVISPAGGERLAIRIYGDCHPMECDWGAQEAKTYSDGPHSAVPESLVVHYATGFADKEIVLRLAGPGELAFEMRTDFHDGSERHDFTMTGQLRRSTWAGPAGQSWDRMPQLATGWGGGARSGSSPPPDESFVAFDPLSVRAVETGDHAKLEAPGIHFTEGTVRDVQRALDVIRHYRFDRFCKTRGVPFWKRGEDIPSDAMGGADCLYFNPTTAHGVRVARDWKIVDGTQWLADTAADKAAADQVLALIRYYRLGRECFVGGHKAPLMTYWLVH